MIRLGAKFTYNGKEWSIIGFSNNKVHFSDGKIKSALDFALFGKFVEQGHIRIIAKKS